MAPTTPRSSAPAPPVPTSSSSCPAAAPHAARAGRPRAAGADLVLELPRGGKLAAQNAAAEQASGEILAFSDANSEWRPDALRRLVAPFSDPEVGYACGRVHFLDADGDNLEGAYWRYEMTV